MTRVEYETRRIGLIAHDLRLLETLNGTLEIHSPPGAGTKLVASFPIEPS